MRRGRPPGLPGTACAAVLRWHPLGSSSRFASWLRALRPLHQDRWHHALAGNRPSTAPGLKLRLSLQNPCFRVTCHPGKAEHQPRPQRSSGSVLDTSSSVHELFLGRGCAAKTACLRGKRCRTLPVNAPRSHLLFGQRGRRVTPSRASDAAQNRRPLTSQTAMLRRRSQTKISIHRPRTSLASVPLVAVTSPLGFMQWRQSKRTMPPCKARTLPD